MHINNVLPVLIKFLFSEGAKHPDQSGQSSSQNSKPVQQHLSKPASEILKNPLMQKANTTEHLTGANNKSNSEPGQPSLIPLPLKSDIFPKSYFYKVQDNENEKSTQESNEEQNKLAFGLRAPSLGRLYFFIIQQGNKLSIKCAAASYEVSREINENFNYLKDTLQNKGWEDISCTCIHVENPDELPGISSINFIDLKI